MRCYEIDLSKMLKVTMLNKTEIKPPLSHITRRINEYIVYVIKEGSLCLLQNDEEIRLMPGDVYIFNIGEYQKPKRNTECTFYYLHFITEGFSLGIVLKVPKDMRSAFSYAKDILKVGMPYALSGSSVTIAGMVTTAFVATIGDYALSAKVYYTNILSYAYLFSSSVGNANALLVGRRFGAGEYDKITRMNKQLTGITRGVNLLISSFIIILRAPLLKMFTESREIIALSLGVFILGVPCEISRETGKESSYRKDITRLIDDGTIYASEDISLLLEHFTGGMICTKNRHTSLMSHCRRTEDGTRIVFLTNTSMEALKDTLSVKEKCRNLYLFDAESGRVTLKDYTENTEGISFEIYIEPLKAYIYILEK